MDSICFTCAGDGGRMEGAAQNGSLGEKQLARNGGCAFTKILQQKSAMCVEGLLSGRGDF